MPVWQLKEKAEAMVINEPIDNAAIVSPLNKALEEIREVLTQIEETEPNKSFPSHFSNLMLLCEFDLSGNPKLGDVYFAFRFMSHAKKELNVFFLPSNQAHQTQQNNRIFLVHGHDVAWKERVARFITKLDYEIIILQETPNSGATIIEKFERESNVGFAIVLLTGDDLGEARIVLEARSGVANYSSLLKLRARQNVVLELGHFIGKLGRKHVCALTQNGIEIPSDIIGVGYITLDDGGAWKLDLAKELQAAGYPISSEKLFKL